MSVFKTKYRIILDEYGYFTVQSRVWWFPIFLRCSQIYRNTTLNEAKKELARYKDNQKNKGSVVYVES